MASLPLNRIEAIMWLRKFPQGESDSAHYLKTEAIMKALAKKFGEDEEYWAMIGLLHDVDWTLTKENWEEHCIKAVEMLKEKGFDMPMMFNQNDLAGYRFVADIMEKAEITECKSIRYDIMSEYKKDINDLLLDGGKIANRIETRALEYFEDIASSLAAIHKAQNSPKIEPVTKEDLKLADRACERSQEQEQER